jgi:exodeoxyribonuclease VII large subunit
MPLATRSSSILGLFAPSSAPASSTADVGVPASTEDEPSTVVQVMTRIEASLKSGVGRVCVRGEISEFKKWNSGHWYFQLKDADATLPCFLGKPLTARVDFAMADGQEVIADGAIVLYRAQSRAQLRVERVRLAGQGALLLRLAKLKERFAAEGLFDLAHKKPLPLLPRTIGVVTSPQGAAIHDVVKVIRARFPTMPILLSPTRVQGDKASLEIAAALTRLDNCGRCDVIIVGRGGGSLEDLMSFNMEAVVRAIYACQTPVVSMVGHESDVTLADLVADVRAATPSHAAQIACPEYHNLENELSRRESDVRMRVLDRRNHAALQLQNCEQRLAKRAPPLATWRLQFAALCHRLESAFSKKLVDTKARDLAHMAKRLTLARPVLLLQRDRTDVTRLFQRMTEAVVRRHRESQHRLSLQVGSLHALSPLEVLQRGYALVQDDHGTVVVSAKKVTLDQPLTVRFADGHIAVRVTNSSDEDPTDDKKTRA